MNDGALDAIQGPWVELDDGERLLSVETIEDGTPGLLTLRVWIECAEDKRA